MESNLATTNKAMLKEHNLLLSSLTKGSECIDFEKDYPEMHRWLEIETCISFVTDIAKRGYLFLHPNFANFTGYSDELAPTKNLAFLHSIIYPEDVQDYCLMFKIWYEHLAGLPLVEKMKSEAQFQFRIVKSDGTKIWVMLKFAVFELDKQGVPCLEKGCFIDEEHLNTNVKVSGTIMVNGVPTKMDLDKYRKTTERFTHRELEVLSLLHHGLSHKAIADKFARAVSTISKHTENIRRKDAEHLRSIGLKPRNIKELINELVMQGKI